jgi:hypothetical protein
MGDFEKFYLAKNMKYLVIAILLMFNNACKGQKREQMERFDISDFRKKAVNGTHTFVTDDKLKVRQWQSSQDVFIQETTAVNANETLYQEFYGSGLLKLSGKEFHGFPIGIWREYAKNGSVSREWDEDENYTFTIEELDEKMKDLGVDIRFKRTGVSVTRTDAGPPIYYVTYPISPASPYELYKLAIDGVSGKTIGQEVIKIRN